MRNTIYTCDKCGKELDSYERGEIVLQYINNPTYDVVDNFPKINFPLDLCEDCYNKVLHYITGNK